MINLLLLSSAVLANSCPLSTYIIKDYAITDISCITSLSLALCTPTSSCPVIPQTCIKPYILPTLFPSCSKAPLCETFNYTSPCSHYYIQNNFTLAITNATCDPRTPAPILKTNKICRDPELFDGRLPPINVAVQINSFENDGNGEWADAFGSKSKPADIFVWNGGWSLESRYIIYKGKRDGGNSSISMKIRSGKMDGASGDKMPTIMFTYRLTGPAVTKGSTLESLSTRSGLRFYVDNQVEMDYVNGNIDGAWSTQLPSFDKEYLVSWEYMLNDYKASSVYEGKIEVIILNNAEVVVAPPSLSAPITTPAATTASFPVFGVIVVLLILALYFALFIWMRKRGIFDKQGIYGNLIPHGEQFEQFPGQNADSRSMELRRYGNDPESFAFLGEDEIEEIELSPLE